MNIKELLQLAGKQGNVVVINELGELQGVFLSAESYQSFNKGSAEEVSQSENITEKVNREILAAQLEDDGTAQPLSVHEAGGHVLSPMTTARSINSLINDRAEELFKSMPYGRAPRPVVDMRAEVIDPNYNFSTPDGNDDEEIKPNFDNI